MPTIATPPPAGLTGWRDDVRDHSSLGVRLRVALHRRTLTEELSEGANPSTSPELALRADQLVTDRERRILARTWSRAIQEAHQPARGGLGGTLVRRRDVLEAEAPIRVMIDRLRDGQPVAAEGMALIERMVTDGVWSPLYTPTAPSALRRLTVLATAALEPGM